MKTKKLSRITGLFLLLISFLLTFLGCNKSTEEDEEFVMTPPAEPFLTYVFRVLQGDTGTFESMSFYYEDDDRFLPFALLMCHHYKYVHANCAVFHAKISYCNRHGIPMESVIDSCMRYLEQGAKYGDMSCQATLSHIYLEGRYNVPIDSAKGRMYQLLMDQSDPSIVGVNMSNYRRSKEKSNLVSSKLRPQLVRTVQVFANEFYMIKNLDGTSILKDAHQTKAITLFLYDDEHAFMLDGDSVGGKVRDSKLDGYKFECNKEKGILYAFNDSLFL